MGPENYTFGAFLHKHDNFARLLSHTFMLYIIGQGMKFYNMEENVWEVTVFLSLPW